MTLRLILAALFACGVALLTNEAFQRKQIERDLAERAGGLERFVDVGVVIKTVVADPNGEHLLEGKPRLTVVDEWRLGGVVDTKRKRPTVVGISRAPRIWYASPEQAEALKHEDPTRLGQLIYGSEGAGKTRLLAMWHYVRWIDALGQKREGGQTAPTTTRLAMVRQEMFDMFADNWFTYLASKERFTMCDGTRIQLVSTYRQSAAQGSPIQGYNWSWCGRDEAQDQIDVHEDIESRGRSAMGGRYWQLATATAKDDPTWRTLRDQLIASGTWIKRELSIFRSPFISQDFVSKKRGVMSDREFRRRYGDPDTGKVEDLPPELAIYPAWSRKTNLVPLPNWVDVTAHELRAAAPNNAPIYSLLVGHDPGTLVDVSLFLKAMVTNERAYHRGVERPKWFVLGELNTPQSTTEAHIESLLETVRERWQLNLLTRQGRYNPEGQQILVRADPAGNSDNRTDKSVYTQFANAGIRIKPATYNQNHTGHGRVPKDAGIEVVNTLFCSASGERRLFVVRNPDGSPAAPKLVAAIESSERDSLGKAETQRKDKADVSHWPAALRYALWAIERPRLQLMPREES